MEVQHLATSCIKYNLKLWPTGRKKYGCMRIRIGFQALQISPHCSVPSVPNPQIY